MRSKPRVTLWAIFGAAALLGAAAIGPIPQPAEYHALADQRTLFGIPRAADVLSNLVFLFVGLYGLSAMETARRVRVLRPMRMCYGMFFCTLIATAAGSAWYHWAPDDARLLWDRLPIAVACSTLLSIVLRQCLNLPRCISPLLLGFALLSVAWWGLMNDLRPYLLLQLATMVVIPVAQQSAAVSSQERRAFGAAVGCYVLAKLCEMADVRLYELLPVSGHTLKHLLAGLGAFFIAHYFVTRAKARRSPVSG